MFPTRLMLFAVGVFFSVALISLMFKAPDRDRIQIANLSSSAVEIAKSEDRIFDNQSSQSQTDITGSIHITSTKAPTHNSSAASTDLDQSLAIEFPIAAYEPHTPKKAVPSRVRANAANRPRTVSNSPQVNSAANNNYYKPVELPKPNFTTSAY
jgi:hypothetical protein